MTRAIVVSPDGHEIGDLVARLPAGRVLLGLAGAPGAGKSTLAAALATAYAAPVVPMDGFHRREAELVELGRLDAKGAPDTFDAAAYADLLDRIHRGGSAVRAPAFDHGAADPVADAIVVPADVGLVVTEGNYLLLDQPEWVAVRARLDAVWQVVADESTRVERLVRRHVAAGRPLADACAWVAAVDQPNARLVDAAAPRADVLLDLTDWTGHLVAAAP